MTDREKRLIAANDLWQKTFVCDEVAEVRKFIENAATVDAVEVVRCKNCKHWHHSGYCKLIGMAVDRGHNDYCCYGERKDNELVER